MKREISCTQYRKGDLIVVYMDDDDYYPPQRVEHCDRSIIGKKIQDCICVPVLVNYMLYFKHIDQDVSKWSIWTDTHATAATFAFRRALVRTIHNMMIMLLYAEERSFLKDYTIPFVQLDPMKTILVFSHHHNSVSIKKTCYDMRDPNDKFQRSE